MTSVLRMMVIFWFMVSLELIYGSMDINTAENEQVEHECDTKLEALRQEYQQLAFHYTRENDQTWQIAHASCPDGFKFGEAARNDLTIEKDKVMLFCKDQHNLGGVYWSSFTIFKPADLENMPNILKCVEDESVAVKDESDSDFNVMNDETPFGNAGNANDYEQTATQSNVYEPVSHSNTGPANGYAQNATQNTIEAHGPLDTA
eukprot:281056_1